jgi:SAM-dependent methyltransferase
MGSPVQETPALDVTNRFVLDFALAHGGRVLDYGCGAGLVVRQGRAQGLDIYGADVFYGGSQSKAEAEASGLFGTVIRDMSGGRIPFPDGFFDLVTNNQVMEHVEDLDATLREIHRVLRSGGKVLSVFPSKDVWREGHIGIPFAHWFSRGSDLRFLYTWALRSAGLGTWKEQAPTPKQWAADKLDWIDRWTRYRSREEIFRTYERYFRSATREKDYIRYRLRERPGPVRRLLESTTNWPIVSGVEVGLFRKLAFLVILSEKA